MRLVHLMEADAARDELPPTDAAGLALWIRRRGRRAAAEVLDDLAFQYRRAVDPALQDAATTYAAAAWLLGRDDGSRRMLQAVDDRLELVAELARRLDLDPWPRLEATGDVGLWHAWHAVTGDARVLRALQPGDGLTTVLRRIAERGDVEEAFRLGLEASEARPTTPAAFRGLYRGELVPSALLAWALGALAAHGGEPSAGEPPRRTVWRLALALPEQILRAAARRAEDPRVRAVAMEAALLHRLDDDDLLERLRTDLGALDDAARREIAAWLARPGTLARRLADRAAADPVLIRDMPSFVRALGRG